MKRKLTLCIIFVLIVSAFFTACGKSEQVKSVESLISEIGTVDENSEKAIMAAESAYDGLSDEDKNKVENYNTLLTARKDYDAIPKDIELTASNISDYLEIRLSYGETEISKILGINFADTEVILTVYPVVDASFNNVEITAEAICPLLWDVYSTDPGYQEEDSSKLLLSFRLPSNGEYSETHTIGRSMWTGSPDKDCELHINSVKGTVTLK